MQDDAPARVPRLFAQARERHRRGELQAARSIYERILDIEPGHFDALYVLGILAAQSGDYRRAAQFLTRAVDIDPRHAGAHNNLGNVLKELEHTVAAVDSYDRALALKPDYADAHYNRGIALQELGRFESAVASFDAAIALAPGRAETYNNRGIALMALGRLDAAVLSYGEAIALQPDFVPAFCNRGHALHRLGRLAAALADHERAIAIQPGNAQAHYDRGNVLQSAGRFDDAVESYRRALAIKSDFAAAHGNMGAALLKLGQFEAAARSFGDGLALDPGVVDFYYNRGVALHELADVTGAEASYRAALQLKPDSALARWAVAFLSPPPLMLREEDIAPSRRALDVALDELDQWFTPSRMDLAHEAVATRRPFYLAYQEEDNRHLMSKYGALCHRLMRHWQQTSALAPTPLSASGRIRLGIVSNHICAHSVWTAIVRGIVSTLDQQQFEVHVFHLGSTTDQETDLARARATSFIHEDSTLAHLAKGIVEKRIEVLVYPEIGMHALTSQAASLRLAPVQLAMWGHPDTSGLPTIDYYISGADFESDEADRFYTEKLVKLPNLGCRYTRQHIDAVPPAIARLNLQEDRPLLLCPGTTFKYMPRYDALLAEIARQLGKCTFVLFSQQPRWTSILKARLGRAFRAAGLDIDAHVRFVPWLGPREFSGLMREADVFLDTIGFSGFNTAMQAVECRLPIVARRGRFMRGRLASAILTRMGMAELVAATDEEYVGIAVRLARDRIYRQRIRVAIDQKDGVLFDDPEPIRALEAFLLDLCRPVASRGTATQ